MGKVTIYGKNSAVALETINNVKEHYCTNGMFYVKAKDQEFYFSLETISMIRVESESEDKDLSEMQEEEITYETREQKLNLGAVI